MRTILAATGLSLAAVLASGMPALAAAGVPPRPAGQVALIAPSVNGGDNGWGNCGHNSSGGAAHTGTMGPGGGNGGFKPGECVTTDDPGDDTAPDTTATVEGEAVS
jgi:hypothetical protein